MHLGYAYSCAFCHNPISKFQTYLVLKKPTRNGTINKYYHPICFKSPKEKKADLYLSVDQEPEVRIG